MPRSILPRESATQRLGIILVGDSRRRTATSRRARRRWQCSLRAGDGNEKRTPPPIRIAGAGFGPLLFKSLLVWEVFPRGADNRTRAPPVAFQQSCAAIDEAASAISRCAPSR